MIAGIETFTAVMAIGKAEMGPDADITEFVKPLERIAGVQVGKKA